MANDLTAKSSSLEAAIKDGKMFDVSAEETRRIYELVQNSSKSEAVKDFKLKFDSDSDNERAVWIHLVVGEDPNPSPDKISELNAIARKVRSALLEENLDIWPYVDVRSHP